MALNLNLNTLFIDNLPADTIKENYTRQVQQACYSFVTPQKTTKPELLHVSKEMMQALGMPLEQAATKDFLEVFTGNRVLPNTSPFAMNYGGHQFGHWAGQLGDGRAINLFGVNHQAKTWMLQLKGAGKTPYSRSGDGLAVLRSSIREYLCSEAMHHLGVPTTRALSLAITGDKVLRDKLYDGHPEYEKGAVVCRVAPSFLRFGNYEIFAARNDIKSLKQLADYTITQHFSNLGVPSKKTYIKWFAEISQLTLDLIIHWQRVGFVHGVLNTDNMSVLGLTIDYGPYGWLEGFDFGWTPNTTDAQHKRYRYGNQPNIALWNLYQLANALYPLIEEAAPLEAILQQFKTDFEAKSLVMMRAKLGLQKQLSGDLDLIEQLETSLLAAETDMTIFFRQLASFEPKKTNGLQCVAPAFYSENGVSKDLEAQWEQWFLSYQKRLQSETLTNAERKQNMHRVNPKYVFRNYMAQRAIEQAEIGDYSLIEEFFELLKHPYSEQPKSQKWYAKRPEWARDKVGCSMLSCSS